MEGKKYNEADVKRRKEEEGTQTVEPEHLTEEEVVCVQLHHQLVRECNEY